MYFTPKISKGYHVWRKPYHGGGLDCCLKYNIPSVIGIFEAAYITLYKRMGWVPQVRVQKNDLAFGHWHVSYKNYAYITHHLPRFEIKITQAAHNKLKEWTTQYDKSTLTSPVPTY